MAPNRSKANRFKPSQFKLSRFKPGPTDPPLAWAQLSHQKVRFGVALMGVCFADILMFTQLGLQALLSQGTTLLHESLKGDLFLVAKHSSTIQFGLTFPKAVLYQTGAVEGVAQANPLYLDSANWVNPDQLPKSQYQPPNAEQSQPKEDLFGNTVRVIAFNPTQPLLNIPEVNQQLNRLTAPNTVLFDRLSQPSLGDITALISRDGEATTVMGNQRTYVAGLFNMGSTLFDKGNVVMSDWTYGKRFGQSKLEQVNIGIVTLQPGADLKATQTRLKAALPSVQVLTQPEFITQEQRYQDTEPNGIILKFGTIVGFVVGVIIVYQVLHSDVSDHLPEYATLKAMGYSDRALLIVVLQEAVILAVLGFAPGFVASIGIYQLLTHLTRIPLAMKATVAVQVFVLTVIMCGISGAIATSKLRSADPAEIF
jgi:putative ABC transport system permease protein